MKFYYKDKLLRTSKTHEYTHAVVCEDEELGTLKCIGCRSTRQGAESFLNSELNGLRTSIASYREAIELVNQGQTHRWVSYTRGYRFREKLDSVEEYEKWLANTQESLAYREKHWKVVALEQR